jgi:hypothetical protein
MMNLVAIEPSGFMFAEGYFTNAFFPRTMSTNSAGFETVFQGVLLVLLFPFLCCNLGLNAERLSLKSNRPA